VGLTGSRHGSHGQPEHHTATANSAIRAKSPSPIAQLSSWLQRLTLRGCSQLLLGAGVVKGSADKTAAEQIAQAIADASSPAGEEKAMLLAGMALGAFMVFSGFAAYAGHLDRAIPNGPMELLDYAALGVTWASYSLGLVGTVKGWFGFGHMRFRPTTAVEMATPAKAAEFHSLSELAPSIEVGERLLLGAKITTESGSQAITGAPEQIAQALEAASTLEHTLYGGLAIVGTLLLVGGYANFLQNLDRLLPNGPENALDYGQILVASFFYALGCAGTKEGWFGIGSMRVIPDPEPADPGTTPELQLHSPTELPLDSEVGEWLLEALVQSAGWWW
jgi:hypothetical protein